MQNQYGWNLLEKPIVFSIQADSKLFSLAELPPKARKIKLFLHVRIGDCQTGNTAIWSLYTSVDMIKTSATPYNQNAICDNTENCVLRLDERKIIEVSRSGNFPSGNFGFSITVLGYK